MFFLIGQLCTPVDSVFKHNPQKLRSSGMVRFQIWIQATEVPSGKPCPFPFPSVVVFGLDSPRDFARTDVIIIF